MGETGQPLHNRMNGHRFNITHGHINESPVAAHLTNEGHTEIDMLVMIIDRCWREDNILRISEKVGGLQRWILRGRRE